MNLAVTKATCDLLTLKIPWTSLSSKPVTLTLNRVDIDLREPEVIQPPHNAIKKLSDKKKTSSNSSSSRSDIMDNAQLVVNNVHITIQTLGGTLVMIDLDNIVVQSTNDKWAAVDLNQSRTIDKEQGSETLYKKLTVKSITMALLTEKSAHMILQQIPLRIQLMQKRRIKDSALLTAEIEFVLDDVKFQWTRPEWLLMVDLGRGFQQCLSRPVPEPPASANPLPTTSSGSNLAIPPSTDVCFKIRLDKWSFDFLDSPKGDTGYSFFGQGLLTVFNSAKASIARISNDKTGDTTNTEVEETVITIMVNTVNFKEVVPSKNFPFIVSSKDQTASTPVSSTTHLLKGTFILRRPTELDSNTKYVPLIGIDLSLALSNLQIVADRRVWKGLIRLLSIPRATGQPVVSKEKEEDTLTAAQNNLSKLKESLKLGEDWYSQIKLNIKASDIRLILPQEVKGQYQTVALYLELGSFGMANFSDWKITPNLSKGISLLAAPAPAPPINIPKTVGVPQKLTFQIEGVSIALHSGGRVANILAPTGVKLFIHYFERETKTQEKGKPNLEVIFQSGEFNLQSNEQQFKYLAFVGRKYLNPRKIKAALSAQVKQAKETAATKLKETMDDLQKTNSKEDLVTPIKGKVQSTLEAYKWVVYIHFNKGVFKVPLQFFLSPDVPAEKPAIMDNPLAPTPSDLESPSIEDLLSANSTDLCELKYDSMDLAFENNLNGQGVVIQLGSFQATGLDHPKLPSVVTLLPLKITEEEKAHQLEDIESLVFRYKRKRRVLRSLEVSTDDLNAPIDEDYLTDVWFRLQGMQVKISSKPNHPGLKMGMGLPDIQALVNRAVSLIQERQSDIEVVKANAAKIDTSDVKWGVELGNSEVVLEEIDKNGAPNTFKSYGTVRLADAQRQAITKAYMDLETQLIKAKTSLLMQETERDDFNTKIAALEKAVAAADDIAAQKTKKLNDDFLALESKFIQAKVTIAQHQMENDNLQSQINRLSKK